MAGSYFRVELAQLAGCEPGLRALTCRAEAHTQDITHTALALTRWIGYRTAQSGSCFRFG